MLGLSLHLCPSLCWHGHFSTPRERLTGCREVGWRGVLETGQPVGAWGRPDRRKIKVHLRLVLSEFVTENIAGRTQVPLAPQLARQVLRGTGRLTQCAQLSKNIDWKASLAHLSFGAEGLCEAVSLTAPREMSVECWMSQALRGPWPSWFSSYSCLVRNTEVFVTKGNDVASVV